MHWEHPAWLWAQSVPLLALLASIAAYLLQKRRMRRFGDNVILGVTYRSGRRLLRALLLALAASCAAAITAGPVRKSAGESHAPPSVKIVLDFKVEKSPGETARVWEVFCDGVELLSALVPSARLSVSGLEDAEGLVIPETSDVDGLLLILNGFLPRETKMDSAQVSEKLAALLARKDASSMGRIVLVSTRTRRELEDLWLSLPTVANKPLLMRLPPEGDPSEYGLPGSRGDWNWSGQEETVRRFLENQVTGWNWPAQLKLFSITQSLAFAGFLFLLMEIAAPLFTRAGTGGFD